MRVQNIRTGQIAHAIELNFIGFGEFLCQYEDGSAEYQMIRDWEPILEGETWTKFIEIREKQRFSHQDL